MYNVLITGAGKIGSMIAALLSDCDDYHVVILDKEFTNSDITRLLEAIPSLETHVVDVTDQMALQTFVEQQQIHAIISSLPYFLNQHLIPVAKAAGCHYFDLTEDTATADLVKATASNATHAFVPQCGLAPGFVSVAAKDLLEQFDECKSVNCRVGALPQHSNHALQYALTWSTDGLINIYGNPCQAIENGEVTWLRPLDGYETLQIDGLQYEAFNTSGGLGGLTELCAGKVRHLNYKTIRYPGHWQFMRVLMQDLKLNQKRDLLKSILEDALPTTYDDVVLLYIAVNGIIGDRFIEKTYTKKVYPKVIQNLKWSAIQITTGAEVCAVVDLILTSDKDWHGYVLQESFSLNEILNNRFGQLYEE